MITKINNHVEIIQEIFDYTVKFLFGFDTYNLKIMQRRVPVNVKKITLGYLNFQKKIICIDIFTPKRRQPKSINSILRILAHEIAHIQKPPYYQKYRGKLIIRQHYPAFYKQVNKNIKKIKKDTKLNCYFKI